MGAILWSGIKEVYYAATAVDVSFSIENKD